MVLQRSAYRIPNTGQKPQITAKSNINAIYGIRLLFASIKFECYADIHGTLLHRAKPQLNPQIFLVAMYWTLESFVELKMTSMGYCKKDVTPLLMRWSYVFLEPTHRYIPHRIIRITRFVPFWCFVLLRAVYPYHWELRHWHWGKIPLP